MYQSTPLMAIVSAGPREARTQGPPLVSNPGIQAASAAFPGTRRGFGGHFRCSCGVPTWRKVCGSIQLGGARAVVWCLMKTDTCVEATW